MQIVTGPVPASSSLIPEGAKVALGVISVWTPETVPIVLLPGFEYHISEWRDPVTGEQGWRLTRRVASKPNGHEV